MERPQNHLSLILEKAKSQPDTHLSDAIWHIICTKQARMSRNKSIIYGTIGVLSLVTFIKTAIDLADQFRRSGFYQYLSLAFSDGRLVLSYWRELALSLADSLPLTSLALALLLLLILFVSLRKVMHQFKNQLQTA
jgi:hypothetical protein